MVSLLPGSLECLASKKSMRSVPETWGCTYNVLPWSAKGMRTKRDKILDSHAAEKGAKKLVSSNFAKILE